MRMFFMGCLPCHTQGFGNLSPCPSLLQRFAHGLSFQFVGHKPQSHNSSQGVRGLIGGWECFEIGHVSTIVDKDGFVNYG